jgi:hypothetical protein
MSRGHLFFSGGCSTLKLLLGKRSTLLALECLQFAQVFSQNGRDLAAEMGSDYSPLFRHWRTTITLLSPFAPTAPETLQGVAATLTIVSTYLFCHRQGIFYSCGLPQRSEVAQQIESN